MSKDYPLPRDRGNKKWTSLMLPEHRQRLLGWKADLELLERPLLTSERRQELACAVQQAFEEQTEITIEYFQSRMKIQFTGTIHRCRPDSGSLTIVSAEDECIIRFMDILNII